MTSPKYVRKRVMALGIVISMVLASFELDAQFVNGCTYPAACNYNSLANDDDGSCVYPDFGYDCAGTCLFDLNNNGLCDMEEVTGCIFPDAINYNPMATLDDGSCVITCRADFNSDGIVAVNDLLLFLVFAGNSCPGAGCMDPNGCNYNPEATFDLGYCEYPPKFYNCEGLPLDTDGDGVPDELEIAGCMDPEAENYNPEATDDNGSCEYIIQNDEHSCGAGNVHNSELVYGAVTDIDGNTYKTIMLGDLEWMAENLNTSRYANGDLIPNVVDNSEWADQTEGAWCYYDNDVQYACPYGKLYNWFVTLDERNVCPTGWHVPTDEEWTELTDYLGGESVAGGKMKSSGTEFWVSPNAGATNESGFSGLPGGARSFIGHFTDFGSFAYWWSSTEIFDYNAWTKLLYYNNDIVYRSSHNKGNGFSVRCLRD